MWSLVTKNILKNKTNYCQKYDMIFTYFYLLYFVKQKKKGSGSYVHLIQTFYCVVHLNYDLSKLFFLLKRIY